MNNDRRFGSPHTAQLLTKLDNEKQVPQDQASAVAEASAIQLEAAHDPTRYVRVISGPGSGKSKVIEERVKWLLSKGVTPKSIYVLSFTNASVKDLKARILKRCEGSPEVNQIGISTIHSLALRLLKSVGQLEQYPTDPRILSDWEIENIFDAEFGAATQIKSKMRRQDIRLFHAAVWETGRIDHPNYQPPDKRITEEEKKYFDRFHKERTQTYACVLPGEVVNKCLELVRANVLNPVESIGVKELIVDEFQDLNPTDLQFIHQLVGSGVRIFVAGDDDQSVYSFRYAAPEGIQRFVKGYPGARHHELKYCFRCTPAILNTSASLITATQGPDRIAKHPISIYSFKEPMVSGRVYRWRFDNASTEAKAIAESCEMLIRKGIQPDEIFVLLRNKKVLLKNLKEAFEERSLPFSIPRSNEFADSTTERILLALLRIVCEGAEDREKDYIAHRILLGFQKGVAAGRCNSICKKLIANNLNFRDLFYKPLSDGIFTPSELKAIQKVAEVCAQLHNWEPTDTLESRLDTLSKFVDSFVELKELDLWEPLFEELPAHMTLRELRDYISADDEELQLAILREVRERLEQEGPEPVEITPKIRILTIHGAKGLTAKAVFIPGLEEGILPSQKTLKTPGLLQEEARLLYVSITRAQALCILSYCRKRPIYGKVENMTYSQFAPDLNGPFLNRHEGLTEQEAAEVANIAKQL